MTGEITYRDDHDVDLDQLSTLFASAGWHDRIADRERLRSMVAGSRYVVSAWDGVILIGFARAISDGATNAYVSTVAVLPAYQRRKVGLALVKRLLDGKDHLTFALHARRAIHPFYEACGFSQDDEMLRRPRKW